MRRNLQLISACALALAFCAAGHGQDSPSLGDVARKAQKDKANKPPAKVLTNDDMHAGSSATTSVPAVGSGRAAQPRAASEPAAGPQSAAEAFDSMKSALDQLESQGRATLARNVLDGNATDFPGRAEWEAKLFAAKQSFVNRSRDVLQKATQLEAAAQTMQDVQDPNDPRAKKMMAKLQQLSEEATQARAAFQAVVTEGKSLAGMSAAQ